MLWLVAAATAAHGAPAGYSVTEADADGCELSLGPADATGVVPMHDDIWSAVVTSDIREAGDRALVWQTHQSKGIANREVLLWMKHETVGGADRYTWTQAGDRPLTLTEGNVATGKDDGYWQVQADPRGGVKIVHHLEYDPGGSVPGFMVRWFQTSGLKANLAEARAALR